MNSAVDFSEALKHLRQGLRCRRPCWPQGNFIAHQFTTTGVEVIWLYRFKEKAFTVSRVVWAPAQVDILALDWELDHRPFTFYHH